MDPEIKIEADISQTSENKNTESKAEEKEKKKDPAKLYPARLSKFKTFYTMLVILAAAGIGIAIATAILSDLLLGAVIAIVTVFCYVRFCTSEMRDKLGLTYKTDTASLTITSCRPRYGDVLYIPAKLLWYDVEAIGDEAFKAKKNTELREVYFPKSLKKIGKDIFVSCPNLEAVRFEGTKEEWDALKKDTDFENVALTFGAMYPSLPSKKKANSNKK